MSRYYDTQIKDKLIIKQTTITTNMTHRQNDAFQLALDSGELFNLDFQFTDAEEWRFAMDRVSALGVHRKSLQEVNRNLEREHGVLLAEHLVVVRENNHEICALAATAIQTIARCRKARKRTREIEAEWAEARCVRDSGQYTLNDGPGWDDYDEEDDEEENENVEMDRRHRATQSVARLRWDHERQDGWEWRSVMAKNHMVRCFEQELVENADINHVLTIGCNV